MLPFLLFMLSRIGRRGGKAKGYSMSPFIRHGDNYTIRPIRPEELRVGMAVKIIAESEWGLGDDVDFIIKRIVGIAVRLVVLSCSYSSGEVRIIAQ